MCSSPYLECSSGIWKVDVLTSFRTVLKCLWIEGALHPDPPISEDTAAITCLSILLRSYYLRCYICVSFNMFTAVSYNSFTFHENKTIFVTSGTPGSIQMSGVRF